MKKKREEGRRIVAMNKYPHKLGSGGYQGKREEWAKILELNKDDDSPVVRIKNTRAQNFIMARSELTTDGRIVLHPTLRPVAQRMVRVVR